MSEKAVAEKLQSHGKDVEAVYFVTSYPELVITMQAEDHFLSKGKEIKQKAVRLLFQKQVLPRKLRGQGMLGSENIQGGDRNANPFWGVYKTQDPEVLAFLRKHEYYRTTPQDNKVESKMKLKELNWDPTGLEKGEGILVDRRVSLSEGEIFEAPEDKKQEGIKASVGLKGKKA